MTIRFALLGTGKITERLVPAIKQTEGASLVAVLSRDAERGEEFLRRHELEGAKAYTDLEALLKTAEVDAVVVATPDGLHVQHAGRALECGKHVLVEKPMTTSASDAEVLGYLAGRQHLRLGVGYHLRHHAGHRKVKELVAEGALGTIRHARIQWTWSAKDDENWRAKGDVGRWWTLAAVGTHCIDLARWLLAPLGEPLVVRSTLIAPKWGGRDEVASVLLGFPAGAIVEIFVSCLMVSPRRLEITGDDGAILAEGTLGPKGDGTIVVRRASEQGDVSEPLAFEPIDPFRAEVEDFVASIVEGRQPIATGEDGMANVVLLEDASP